MTADDDYLRLNFPIGTKDIPMSKLGLTWPPPNLLHIKGDQTVTAITEEQAESLTAEERQFVMERISMSQISDEAIAAMTHVVRGAEYSYKPSPS